MNCMLNENTRIGLREFLEKLEIDMSLIIKVNYRIGLKHSV